MSELEALPLLELRIESARGGGSELRVRGDGRFEARTAEHDWRLISEYSPRSATSCGARWPAPTTRRCRT